MPLGRPPIYNPDFHPADCERLGREGKFAVQMARDWGTDVRTIYDWCDQHPAFSLSFTRAKQYRAAWMMEQAQNGLLTDKGTTFNSQVLGMMLKYDGVQLDDRLMKLPALAHAKTFNARSEIVVNAFASGEISAKEANQIVDIIAKTARIDEVTELRAKLEAIEDKLK